MSAALQGHRALDQNRGVAADQDLAAVATADVDATDTADPCALCDQRDLVSTGSSAAIQHAMAALSEPVIGSSLMPLDGASMRVSN